MSVYSYSCVSFPGNNDEENYIYIYPGSGEITVRYAEDGTQHKPKTVKIDRNVLERNVKEGKLPYKYGDRKLKYISTSKAEELWVVEGFEDCLEDLREYYDRKPLKRTPGRGL